jgi:hypothetical protein
VTIAADSKSRPPNKKGSWMDAKSKFREAIRSCDEALDAAVKSEDRSKREVLEQLSALYRRLAKLLVKYMRR